MTRPLDLTEIDRIALIGNFLPRKCGIATYTTDTYKALAAAFPDLTVDVYAMDDRPGTLTYPPEVTRTIPQNDRVAYLDVQRTIDINDGDILTIRSADGRTLNYYVFDVQRNRFAPGKYTMHAVLWTLPVGGFGHCGGDRFDDMNGRREARLEPGDLRRAG